MGLCDRPIGDLSGLRRALLVAEAWTGKAIESIASVVALPLRLLPGWRKRRLTETYLDDPGLRARGASASPTPCDEDVE